MSVDLSFMDLLFDKEDPVIGFEKDVRNDDLKQIFKASATYNEEKQLNNDDWVCSADSFLDSILQMENDEQSFELLQNCDLLNENKTSSDSFHLESSSCSDSGLSSDQQMSPPSIHEAEYDDDIEIKEEIVEMDATTYEEVPVYDDTNIESESGCNDDNNDNGDGDKQDSVIIEDDKQQLPVLNNNQNRLNKSIRASQIHLITSDPVQLQLQKEQPQQLKQNNVILKEHKTVIRTKPIGVTNPNRHVLRVTPITSSNPRSILIPVNMKSVSNSGVRTIKIINATNRSLPVSTIKATKQIPRIISSTTGNAEKKIQSPVAADDPEDDASSMYPRLHLTAEEKRLMDKEGVSLPSHYPLTKQEERELKRIRRKIRNKISAQDSRKRKKEYVDGLEDRVKQCTEENLTLMKRLKALQSQNQSLSTQLKKLQAVVARGTTQTAQPATCLMVLMLSLALVMAPNLRHARSATQRDLSLPEGDSKNPLAGRSRSLLFSKHSDIKLKPSDIFSQESEESWDSGLMSDLEELIQFNNKPVVQPPVDTQYDHDYTESRATNRKRTRSYVVPPLDDNWPPPKRSLTERVENTLEEKINKSRLGTEPLGERNKQLLIHLSNNINEDNDVITDYEDRF